MAWKKFFDTSPVLFKIIAFNVLVFVLTNLFLLTFHSSLYQFNASPFSWSATALIPQLFFRPWSWITHLFLHINFWHILSNMIILYFGGSLFVKSLSQKKLIPVYILGGLMGYLFYVLSFHLFPNLHIAPYVFGASASAIAVLVTAAVISPHVVVRLFGSFQVEFWIIALALVIYDLTSLNAYANSGGHVAHLGGALFGLLFAVQHKNGIDMTKWLVNLIEKIRIFFQGKNKDVRKSFYDKPFISDEEFNLRKKNNQKRVDQILDKVSKSGYSSLTNKEKDFLNKQSQR